MTGAALARLDPEVAAPGARPPGMALLRDGDPASPVFLFPGAGGAGEELAAVAAELRLPGRIWGPHLVGMPPGDPAGGIARQADQAVAAIRAMQPSGPYRLAGYSYGALVALEAARLMLRQGLPVLPPVLIDAYYEQRHWPARAWLLGMARRTRVQLGAILRKPPAQAVRELVYRARRLSARLWSRWDTAHALDRAEPALGPAGNVQALRAYRPRHYPGEVVMVSAADDSVFGCRPGELWRGFCAGIRDIRVEGNHMGVVRDTDAARRVAQEIDRHLGAPAPAPAPLALVVTALRWPATAGLVVALQSAGFRVAALCPRGHPMRHLPGVDLHPMPWRRPQAALARLTAQLHPDLVLPCDEPALALVRQLGQRGPGRWPDLSRAEVIALARAAGVEAPRTQPVAGPADLDAFIAAQGLPVVLKTDGSWGGGGVVIAADRAAALSALRRLGSGPGLARALKRLVVNREPHMMRALLARARPAVHAQAHVAGRDANIAVAVADGEVLAAVAVEVLQTLYPRGPATVIRVIDHPQMLAAARAVLAQTGITGLVGMDFVLDAQGAAHLIEVNIRATPTCRLSLGPGRSPVEALRARFATGDTQPASTRADAVGQVIDLRQV